MRSVLRAGRRPGAVTAASVAPEQRPELDEVAELTMALESRRAGQRQLTSARHEDRKAEPAPGNADVTPVHRPATLLWRQRLCRTATAVAIVVAAALLPGHAASAQTACAHQPRVSLGGVTGFSSLADPAATQQLRASCNVGLYIHAEAWRPLDAASRGRILANFRGTGLAVVELGYVNSPHGYFSNFYKPTFLDQGVRSDTALINGLCHDGRPGALAYIAVARQYGLANVAVVFAPNSGQFRTSRFSDPQWDCVRAAAMAGGALAVDAPPHVFSALKAPYQSFVMDELHWARQNGLKSFFIISPNGSGPRFAGETDRMLDVLAANGATPSNVVFETYDIQRTDAANMVGEERQPGSVAGVALRLLTKLPR